MSRVAYVNGRLQRMSEAGVSIEDRGFQLADGVYEVWAVIDGRLVDTDRHLDRLERSLGELSIAAPMDRRALALVLVEVARRNRVRDGILYLQVTRGVARRDHGFPSPAVKPTLVITARSIDPALGARRALAGVTVQTVADIRWGRCDIKSVGLLPNVLAKQAARDAGAYEAWLVDANGLITEGASTNAWIVDGAGRLRTRSIRDNILRGVTRLSLLDIAAAAGLTVSERPFTVEEAKAAREAFMTSAGTLVTPVIAIDGANIGDGRPGPVATDLRRRYLDAVRTAA